MALADASMVSGLTSETGAIRKSVIWFVVVKHQLQFDFEMFELALRNVNRRALHCPRRLRNLLLEFSCQADQFGARIFQVAFAHRILEFGAEPVANRRDPSMREVIHDILGEGKPFLVGRLRMSEALHPQNNREQQQKISKRAHGDLQHRKQRLYKRTVAQDDGKVPQWRML